MNLQWILFFTALPAFWLLGFEIGKWHSWSGRFLTTQDLENKLKEYMKESEVKALVAEASGRAEEALGEIGIRIADMQKQIDELIAGAGDEEVTDETFLANLNKLKETTDKLADIVTNPEA